MASVYIHIPFCQSKCPYCDFYSLVGKCPEYIDTYVTALCRDIRCNLDPGVSIQTLFIGGGTPSLLDAGQVERLLSALNDTAQISSAAELSIEVNPGSVDAAWLSAVYGLGFNRLSVGVQSFQDQALRRLGRRHCGADAETCLVAARQAGFSNINVDMMFALPDSAECGNSRDTMFADREVLARMAPEHVSVYGLTIESGTPFAGMLERGQFVECCDEEFGCQFMQWHQWLSEQGYEHYEISNFARNGYRCQHNLAYWTRQGCYAFGAGAHAFCVDSWGVRLACAADVDAYMHTLDDGADPRKEVERFDARQAMAEWVYLHLRMHDGVDVAAFQAHFGCVFEQVYADAIRCCGSALQFAEGRWFFPPESWLLYNHHVKNFLCHA